MRHLICHLYPVTAGQKWRRTVTHLAARRSLFNGRRIVSVARDHECDSLDDVRQAFREGGLEVELLDLPNNVEIGETAAFPTLLERVRSTHAGELTLYCHGKGSTWPDGASLAHEWADAMFSVCLDYPELVTRALSTAAIAGPFRRHIPPPDRLAPWHYSGTFYWFRNDVIFAKEDWRKIIPDWLGTEGWPSTQVPLEQSVCLFLDHAQDLYSAPYWDAVVRPAFRRWRDRLSRT